MVSLSPFEWKEVLERCLPEYYQTENAILFLALCIHDNLVVPGMQEEGGGGGGGGGRRKL